MTPESGECENPFARRPQTVSDPDEVAEELRRQSARTIGRAELEARHEQLQRVSPEVGRLDDDALAEFAREDPDAAAALLADLARATDESVRAAARRLAARIAMRPSLVSAPAHSGRPRLETVDEPTAGGDLDLDATLAGLDRTPVLRAEDVRVRDWRRRGVAYVLLVDASGSVAGERLATALLTAGAIATRLQDGDELAVVAFASKALVLRPIGSSRAPSTVLDALLDLRGGGTTDVAQALRAGLAQAAHARSPRRELLLLSDGLATDGSDPVEIARTASRAGTRAHVLALADGDEAWPACRAIAAAGGGRCVALTAPSRAASAVEQALGG